ncbi:DUF2273 domain-containing protein [Paenibacillus sp.]|uniref:DUF2273 domain-containing protein n=1 Tax=Paenibacillus sp. TaxID=58172 RepID=UPI002D35E71B|nr:DUF2273 domain-containing protein [Paenibacillus sp.]HZG55375.1 DUF2273 domain-containing protein [Paenibacillus sp.]
MWTTIAEALLAWVRDGRVGRVAGTAAGILLGVVYLFWGFWDMLAFGLIGFAGYTLGLKSDNREKWLDRNAIARWFSERWHR